jgi:hypothetical protein
MNPLILILNLKKKRIKSLLATNTSLINENTYKLETYVKFFIFIV